MKRATSAAVIVPAQRRLLSSSSSNRFRQYPPPTRIVSISSTDPTPRRRQLLFFSTSSSFSSSSSSSSITNGMTAMMSFLKEVMRTGSFHPPNPILQSLEFPQTEDDYYYYSSSGKDPLQYLPKFSTILPYHLEEAAEQVLTKMKLELVELEMKLTTTTTTTTTKPTTNSDDPIINDQKMDLSSILLELDKIHSPLFQIKEVATLFLTLASNPDQIQLWKDAVESTHVKQIMNMTSSSSSSSSFVYQSSIVYQALQKAITESRRNNNSSNNKINDDDDNHDNSNFTAILLPFRKQGMHLLPSQHQWDSGDNTSLDENVASLSSSNEQQTPVQTQVQQLQDIQDQLQTVQDRLQNMTRYHDASKAMKLQCVSDMYHCLGLTRLQAHGLGFVSVQEMAHSQHPHMMMSIVGCQEQQQQPQQKNPNDENNSTNNVVDNHNHKDWWKQMCKDITEYLQPHLPQSTKLNLEGSGAFLEDDTKRPRNVVANVIMEDDSTLFVLKAKYQFKQCMRLQGVIQGMIDFCNAIYGIQVVEDVFAKQEGWNKNVRLFHLYEKKKDNDDDDDDDDTKRRNNDDTTSSNKTNDDNCSYLGTIYFDPFADAYWRTEEAEELVMTRLFSQTTQQTIAPIVIMALKIRPTWDDDPVPVSWDDTRDLLFHFGKALQLILEQASKRRDITMDPTPIDTLDVLGYFMEMWLQNDGFVYRLAQLSSQMEEEEQQHAALLLEEDTLQILRKDLQKEKALEIVNTIFLSELQHAVFDTFDPRGDETLVALQGRLAKEHLPAGNLPDSKDLSPLLAVFQEHGVNQKFSAYGPLWSELISALIYESFQTTDLRNRDEVHRLGRGVRNLFLRSPDATGGKTTKLSWKEIESRFGKQITAGSLQRVYRFDVQDDKTEEV